MWTQRDARDVCTQRKDHGRDHGRHCKSHPSSTTRNQACRHRDLGHLACRTMRNQWAVVWTVQSLVFCYGGPSKPRWGIKWFLIAHSCTAIILAHGDGFVLTPIISKLCTYISYSPSPPCVSSLLLLWLGIFFLTRLSTTTPGHYVYHGLQ